MSSDVYFYIHETQDLEEECIEQIRIGHLGVFRYFGYNLLGRLEKSCLRGRPLSENDIKRMEVAVLHAHASAKVDMALSSEEFANCYGYSGPEGIEWDELPYPGEITEELTKYIGKYCFISCD